VNSVVIGNKMAISETDIIDRTNWFRNTNDPMYCKIKKLLIGTGIDISTSVLVQIFPDDSSFEYGIIITKNKEIYEFGYDYRYKTNDAGELTEWNNLTNTYKTHNWREDIECGLAITKI
jgi:hypothetical protein